MLAQSTLPSTALLPLILAQQANFPDGTMLENVLTYSPIQYQLISHLLTIGVSAQAVGFVYFLTSTKRSLSRFQPSSNLSAIVMTSAFLLLLWQLIGWSTSFQFDGTVWGLPVGPNGREIQRFLFWGAVSTVFYVYILYLVGNLLFRGREIFPREAYKAMGTTWWLIIISWTLYPLAYLVPLGWQFLPAWGGWAGVTRQFLFTVADIFSKVIFGVLLSAVTQIRSAEEGYEPAIQVQPEGGAAGRDYTHRQ